LASALMSLVGWMPAGGLALGLRWAREGCGGLVERDRCCS